MMIFPLRCILFADSFLINLVIELLKGSLDLATLAITILFVDFFYLVNQLLISLCNGLVIIRRWLA